MRQSLCKQRLVQAEVRGLVEFIFAERMPPTVALRAWSKGKKVGAEILNDERVGPVALVCSLSIIEQALLEE